MGRVRVHLLTAGLLGAGVALYGVLVQRLATPTVPLRLPWPLVAAGFAATTVFAVHLEFRRHAHSFLLSGLPLVLGLYLLSPPELVLARLAGSAAVLVLHRRQAATKLAFNLALFLFETCLAASVFALLRGGQPLGPRGWGAALLATLTIDLAGALVVMIAVSLYERAWQWAHAPGGGGVRRPGRRGQHQPRPGGGADAGGRPARRRAAAGGGGRRAAARLPRLRLPAVAAPPPGAALRLHPHRQQLPRGRPDRAGAAGAGRQPAAGRDRRAAAPRARPRHGAAGAAGRRRRRHGPAAARAAGEDCATWEALAALGCELAQGHYVAPPMPAEEATGWLWGHRAAEPTPERPERFTISATHRR